MADEMKDKTILLVDDDRDILAAMNAALEGQGATIAVASNGDEAVAQAEKLLPDLVVLDMMLPKRSGFLVLERLKRSEKPPHVIMITGNQGHRHKAYAESLGVDLYLNKPFRMEKLIEAIKKLIA